MRATGVTLNGQLFCHGDRVHHSDWDTTGTVNLFNDNNHDEAAGEVHWDDTSVADELDLVASKLTVLS